MIAAQRRYLAIEAAIGGAINAVISVVFVLIVFLGQPYVPVPSLVFDTLPQSFMVTLMSMAVPSVLTSRRIAAGTVSPVPGGRRVPGSVAVRAAIAAVVVAALAWLVASRTLPAMLHSPPSFASVLAGKTLYGALLGAAISAVAVRIALAQR